MSNLWKKNDTIINEAIVKEDKKHWEKNNEFK